jgi:hypothetical protein
MKVKDLDKNNNKEIYIIEDQTKLKNVIVSSEDPYDKLLSSTKEEIWYVDSSDY